MLSPIGGGSRPAPSCGSPPTAFGIALLVWAALLLPAAANPATTTTIYVSGTVSCQWHDVTGVWVESGGGGSGWADWKIVRGHANITTYAAKVQNTTLPTNIRLHVGCGGTPQDWWSNNRTPSTSRKGGPLAGSAKLNAVCNEGTQRPSPSGLPHYTAALKLQRGGASLVAAEGQAEFCKSRAAAVCRR